MVPFRKLYSWPWPTFFYFVCLYICLYVCFFCLFLFFSYYFSFFLSLFLSLFLSFFLSFFLSYFLSFILSFSLSFFFSFFLSFFEWCITSLKNKLKTFIFKLAFQTLILSYYNPFITICLFIPKYCLNVIMSNSVIASIGVARNVRNRNWILIIII